MNYSKLKMKLNQTCLLDSEFAQFHHCLTENFNLPLNVAGMAREISPPICFTIKIKKIYLLSVLIFNCEAKKANLSQSEVSRLAASLVSELFFCNLEAIEFSLFRFNIRLHLYLVLIKTFPKQLRYARLSQFLIHNKKIFSLILFTHFQY